MVVENDEEFRMHCDCLDYSVLHRVFVMGDCRRERWEVYNHF